MSTAGNNGKRSGWTDVGFVIHNMAPGRTSRWTPEDEERLRQEVQEQERRDARMNQKLAEYHRREQAAG